MTNDRKTEAESEGIEAAFASISVEQLGEGAATAGAGWERAIHWHWVDAVLWVSRRDPRLMALVRGYRFYIRERMSSDITELACRNVALQLLDEGEWQHGAQVLRLALEDGIVVAIGIASGEPINATEWIIGPEVHDVLLPAARLMEIWPAEAIEPVDLEDGVHKALKPPSGADLGRWVRVMLDKGHTARELIQLRCMAFPSHAPPSKRQVEVTYRALFAEDFGEQPTSGSMHPKLKERRVASGLAD